MNAKNKESITDFVRRKAKENKVVILALGDLISIDLDEMLDNQPVEGILYDLNRLPEVATAFMEKDPKWINDYAVGLVITRLYERCAEKDKRISELEAKEVSDG